jgi:large-conductance mechanosensitive channel
LSTASIKIGPAKIIWGSFIAVFINFSVIALVVYYGVRVLGLEKLDKKKN